MRLAFDIDGVVLNSIEVMLEYVNRELGSDFTTEDLAAWDLENLGIRTETLWEAVAWMYRQPVISPYEGAVETLVDVYRRTGEPLLFITGRHDLYSAVSHLNALNWISGVPEMIIAGGDRDKKSYLMEYKVDFIIEDDVQYAESYEEAGIGVGLMLRPWNLSSTASVSERFQGWHDVRRWCGSRL
ncbi:MAG: hypothetical protein V2B18_14050 [Pseudomonadota bacterium]